MLIVRVLILKTLDHVDAKITQLIIMYGVRTAHLVEFPTLKLKRRFKYFIMPMSQYLCHCFDAKSWTPNILNRIYRSTLFVSEKLTQVFHPELIFAAMNECILWQFLLFLSHNALRKDLMSCCEHRTTSNELLSISNF